MPELFLRHDPVLFAKMELLWMSWTSRFCPEPPPAAPPVQPVLPVQPPKKKKKAKNVQYNFATLLMEPDWLKFPFGATSTSFVVRSRSSSKATVGPWLPPLPAPRRLTLEQELSGGNIGYARAVPVLCTVVKKSAGATALLDACRHMWASSSWDGVPLSDLLTVDEESKVAVPALPPNAWALLHSYAVPVLALDEMVLRAPPEEDTPGGAVSVMLPMTPGVLRAYLGRALCRDDVRVYDDGLTELHLRENDLLHYVAACALWGWRRGGAKASGDMERWFRGGDNALPCVAMLRMEESSLWFPVPIVGAAVPQSQPKNAELLERVGGFERAFPGKRESGGHDELGAVGVALGGLLRLMVR